MMSEKPTYEELENRIQELEKTESKLKISEAELRESQQVIEGILNGIPARVFWKDQNLVYLGCNKLFAQDAGFADPKDIIGKDDYQMGWRDQAELYRKDDREVIDSGDSKFLIEEPQTTPEGNIITLLTSKTPLRSATGEIAGVLGTYMDITDHKQAELALRQNEQRYKSAQRMGRVGNWEYDILAEKFWGSEETKRIYGFDPENKNFTTDEVENCIPDRETVHQALVDLIEKEKPYDLEFEIRPISGPERKIIKSIAEVVKDESGLPMKVIGVIQDITDLRQADAKLRKSEEKYRILFESSKDANYISSLEGHILEANRSFWDLFGYTEEDLPGLMVQDMYVNPNDRSKFIKEIEEHGFVKDFELELKNKRNIKLDCQITATVQLSPDGLIGGYQGIIRDVTEIRRRKIEKEKLISELQDALVQVKTLSGLLPICSHCKKIRDDKGYWNQIEVYILDHSDAEFSHSICQECAKKYYPDMDIYG